MYICGAVLFYAGLLVLHDIISAPGYGMQAATSWYAVGIKCALCFLAGGTSLHQSQPSWSTITANQDTVEVAIDQWGACKITIATNGSGHTTHTSLYPSLRAPVSGQLMASSSATQLQ